MGFSFSDFTEIMNHVTQLGNSSVLLCITLLASFWLGKSGYGHAAASLWIAFIITAILTVTAKLFFLGCYNDTIYGIRSPSGHAALSLATYGMLGMLFAQATQGSIRAFLNLIVLFLIITIAFSRVSLGYHTVAEVLLGLVAGFIGLVIASTYFFNWKRELLRFNVPLMLLVLCGSAYILHHIEIPAEQWIKQFAGQLKGHIPACAGYESQSGNISRANNSS